MGTLSSVLVRAYGVKRYQLTGPAWLASDYYEITAKLPSGALKDQIPEMLQRLLSERFRMAVHWETKQERIYALVPGKNGLRLKESKADHPGTSFSRDGHINMKGITMAGFADSMSNFADRPFVDMTGLHGIFDITLQISTDDLAGMKGIFSNAGASVATVDEGAVPPSIFSAIEELGLKLETRNAPVKRLIVDSAQKVPTEN